LEIQWRYREAHGRYERSEGDTERFGIGDPEETQEGDTRRWGVQGRNPGKNKEIRDRRSRRDTGRHMEFSKKPGMGSPKEVRNTGRSVTGSPE
jgi:hypothetical protein